MYLPCYKYLLSILSRFCLLIGFTSNGQKRYSIKSKKAISLYESAGRTYRQMDNVEDMIHESKEQDEFRLEDREKKK